jgi:hypothetical protein
MVYAPIIGELGGHQLSTLIGMLLYGSLVYLLFRQEIPHLKKSSLVKLGLMWVGLTILFEFGFGHYVMGHPWSRLWHDYDVREGRVWSLMLVSVGIWPLLIQTLIKRTRVSVF